MNNMTSVVKKTFLILSIIISLTCAIYVKANPIVEKVTPFSTNYVLEMGKSAHVGFYVYPSAALNDAKISFESTNEEVATGRIRGDGYKGYQRHVNIELRAHAPGDATITVKFDNKSFDCFVHVNTPHYTAIEFDSKTSTVIEVGTTGTFKYTATPKIAANYDRVKFISANPNVVTVTEDGKYEAVAKGSARIIAKSENSDTYKEIYISVTGTYPKSISLTPPSYIVVGQTKQIKASISPTIVDYPTITWSSSNSSVLTVDSKGEIYAVKSGIATITATAGNGKSSSVTITVLQNSPTRIYIKVKDTGYTGYDTKVKVGNTLQLAYTIEPSYVNDVTVTWQSDDESIFTIDQTGKVTAVSPGMTLVYALTSDGKMANFIITVTE